MTENIYRLTEEHRRLLRRYYGNFYNPLACGERKPQSEAQGRFVAVCHGRQFPRTTHEFAYMNFRKFVELSGISEAEAVTRDFTFPAPPPQMQQTKGKPLPPSPGYSGEACPRCARKGIRSLLVWRCARDPNVPGEFLGCSRYPKCQYTER